NSPAPGGGSVAALCGSLASALTVMVGNLTVGKTKYQDSWNAAENIISEGKKLNLEFISLMNKDTDAFNVFMAAMKMPKNTDEEKSVRLEAMEHAAKTATETPLSTLETCVKLMDFVVLAAKYGNQNAISDAGVAALLAEAAGKAAAYNVKINLPGIKDKIFADKCKERMFSALKAIESGALETADIVNGVI
ncbi:cyclodeaminase/cyclohydrolase family protein, partial [Cloacibacillus sp.]